AWREESGGLVTGVVGLKDGGIPLGPGGVVKRTDDGFLAWAWTIEIATTHRKFPDQESAKRYVEKWLVNPTIDLDRCPVCDRPRDAAAWDGDASFCWRGVSVAR